MIIDTQYLMLLDELLVCFAAVINNQALYREIFNSRLSSEIVTIMPNNPYYDLDYMGLSIFEVCNYLAHKLNGVNVNQVTKLIDVLEQKDILLKEDPIRRAFLGVYKPSSVRYKLTPNGEFLYINDQIRNAVFGFPYIIEKFEDSIVKVLGRNNLGDEIIGTGFIIRSGQRNIIVTCKHNVDNILNLNFVVSNIQYNEYEVLYHPNKDIDCVLIIVPELNVTGFLIGDKADILDEVITMGYPTIPLSNDAYLMVHKGEVNGVIKDYLNGEERIVFSAKTSSGNSGSPLINELGAVIGIVSNELFDQNAYISKGKPPYYAAIPINVIKQIVS
jgi:S1-C subfamily serine protease